MADFDIAAPGPWGQPTNARVTSAATINANVVKAAPGNLYGWFIYNNTGAAKYVKFYDKATAPVPATDTPKFTLVLAANTTGRGASEVQLSLAMTFAVGISYVITNAVADADATVTAANDVVGTILFV
jgi:hypothetical protein